MKTNKEPRAAVSKERAYQHVLATIRRLAAFGPAEFERWGTAKVDPNPLVLHDLNGQILFYEFSVFDGNKQAGSVKAAASRIIGSPVVSIEFGSRGWDPDKAERQARLHAQKYYAQAKITGTELVVYSYPKVGVKVDLDDKKAGKQSLIFDASDYKHVNRFGSTELEGLTSYSFYYDIVEPQAEEREKRWQLAEKELEAVHAANKKIFAKELKADEFGLIKKAFVPVISPIIFPIFSSKLIKFAPHCTSHTCFELYAQQTNVYCAVATGQMILDFYRYYFTQNEIATAMGTGAGGTSNPGQEAGYESLSNNCLEATFDGTAEWAEAKAEIDANRPLKSGIPGHARACAGWMRQNIFLFGQAPKRWLRIYDPWPWNADPCAGGKIVWEDWDAVTHTNFIYVRHQTTNHA